MRQISQKEEVPIGAGLLRGKWAKPVTFPAMVIVLALGYTFATGPFRAPDEPNHFFRAYEISEGHLVAVRPGGGFLGDKLPQSLEKVARIVAGFPSVPAISTNPAAFAKAWRVDLKSHRRTFLHFPGAAFHSPAMYLPAVAGISLGKMLHAKPLALFYLGRVFNALVGGSLIGLAINRTWRRAPFLVTIAFFPMCLFQVGNLTTDSLTFGISFLWLAEVLQARSEVLSKPPRLRWILIALALSQLRFPYPFLGLLIFFIPLPLIGDSSASRLRFRCIFFAALILPCLLWISVVKGLQVPMRPDVSVVAGSQLQFVLYHPLHFFQILAASLFEFGYEFWRQLIGVLGWLNLPLPTWILVGVSVCLVVTISSSETKALRLTAPIRVGFIALGGLALLLTAVLIYLAWNAVGAPRIEGWQGRYAIPLLPLLACALANEWLRKLPWLGHGALAFSGIANLASIIFLARATWS